MESVLSAATPGHPDAIRQLLRGILHVLADEAENAQDSDDHWHLVMALADLLDTIELMG